MLLFWRIRYLDTRDKQFKDRDLWLETNELELPARATVELCYRLQDSGGRREMLRYRSLFRESKHAEADLNELVQRHGGMGSVFLHDYFEDEDGKELSSKRMAVILTGRPDAVMFPAGARQHDIDYALADKRPVPIDEISLNDEELSVLGYFARDLREMLASAFFKEGPGTLTSSDGSSPSLHTSTTDEEIRSFVTTFRRLYMKGEPAGFVKAVSVFAGVTQGYPLGQWVNGVAGEYEAALEKQPDFVPLVGRKNWPFSRKRLIDVFLYTQYAHQPDSQRARQFQECLAAVGNRRPLLTWLFLTELWACSLHMRNAGVIVADFYDRYREHHNLSVNVLAPVASDNPGIGTLEKKQDREERLFDEAVEKLGGDLWKEHGSPEGGPSQFAQQARRQLTACMDKSGLDRSNTEAQCQ